MPQGTRIFFMFTDTTFPDFLTFWDLPNEGGMIRGEPQHHSFGVTPDK